MMETCEICGRLVSGYCIRCGDHACYPEFDLCCTCKVFLMSKPDIFDDPDASLILYERSLFGDIS